MSVPYCSHNGYFAEMYNNMHIRTGKKAPPFHKLVTGHIQYLQMMGCKGDAKNVRNLLRETERQADAHYCLPDNIMDFIEDFVSKFEESFMPPGFMEPHHCFTISALREDCKMLILVVPEADGSMLYFPFNIVKPSAVIKKVRWNHDESGVSRDPDSFPLDTIRKGIKMDYANMLAEAKVTPELLAGLTNWSCNTFAFKHAPGSGDLEVREWMIERNAIEEQDIDAVKRAMAVAAGVITQWAWMMARPAQEVQWDHDPDWVAPKVSYTEQRKGKIKEPKPRKLRLYVPKQIRPKVDNPDHVPVPTGAKQYQHTRAGYERTLRNGRKIWIDSYTAGDPSLGSTVGKANTIELVPRRER